MVRLNTSGGSRWVWPLIIIAVLAGLALLAFAFLAPPTDMTQPTDQPAAGSVPATGVEPQDPMADLYPYNPNTLSPGDEQTQPDPGMEMLPYYEYGY